MVSANFAGELHAQHLWHKSESCRDKFRTVGSYKLWALRGTVVPAAVLVSGAVTVGVQQP